MLTNVVVLGHVDTGKSTTSGHLFYKCGGVEARVFEQMEKEAKEMGKESFKYAWIMDRLHKERERGISINSSSYHFQTENRKFTFTDCPGQRDFIKTMVNAASLADAALLVVSAETSEFQTGLSNQGQTREHARLAWALGIKQILVVVNKMDCNLVNYSESQFHEITMRVLDLLAKIGYNPENIPVIPVSGWVGDNLLEPSENMSWWQGPTLLEAINSLEVPKIPVDKPLRMPVQDICKIGGLGTVVVGRIYSGVLSRGMLVSIAPINIVTEVLSIEKNYEQLEQATAGDIVGFNANISVREIRRGFVVSDVSVDPALQCNTFTALIIILNHPSTISPGYVPVISCHNANVACKLTKILAKVDEKTGIVLESNPQFLKASDTALVEMQPVKPMCVETFDAYPGMGRILVRDMQTTIAVGVIKSVFKKGQLSRTKPAKK